MPAKKREVAPPSEYEKLVALGMIMPRKGEHVMSPEERLERRRQTTRLSMEARRRATRVLIINHKEEFDSLYRNEREALKEDPDYKVG